MDEEENGAVAWLTLQEMHACGPAPGQGSTTDEKKIHAGSRAIYGLRHPPRSRLIPIRRPELLVGHTP
ncbi:hypothetical protein QC762_0028750 [Podospora pseudocomata]|uniref:Uncharacterized protein n=1 Tax=Podospora pseudocomata TaxID=2093779 RepID=A0ABR0GRX2_9PEZI|nr:hypothetical protein QC762_0028750 [Podospora pseudocomata]